LIADQEASPSTVGIEEREMMGLGVYELIIIAGIGMVLFAAIVAIVVYLFVKRQ